DGGGKVTRMEVLRSVWSIATFLWSVALVRWTALIAAGGIILDSINLLQWIWKNWDWLMSWANTDLFRLVFAVVMLGMFGFGIWRGLKLQAAAEQSNAAAMKAQERQRAELLEELYQRIKAD